MNVATLMSGKTDVTDLTLFFRLEDCLHTAPGAHDPRRISLPNHLMKLQQINMVGLEAAERFFELFGGCFLCLTVDLGHEESLLPVAVPQRLTHADFALATVVVPAVVEEIHSIVERCAYQANAQLLVFRMANVVAAKADDGNLL